MILRLFYVIGIDPFWVENPACRILSCKKGCKILYCYHVRIYGKEDTDVIEKLKGKLDITFLKFVLVGVVNTVVGTAVMFLAYNLLHLSYWISSAANYIVGSICSYFLNKYFTFQNKSKSPVVILKFILNITVCYLIAYGGAKKLILLLLSGLSTEWQDNIAMACGMGLFVILNYFGQRFFAFKEEKREEE